MAANKKLTAVIAGRSLISVERAPSQSMLRFDDGSAMSVRTAASGAAGADTAALPARVAKVRQDPTTLTLDLEGGGSISIATAEAVSCVMVRSRDQSLEYAD